MSEIAEKKFKPVRASDFIKSDCKMKDIYLRPKNNGKVRVIKEQG